MEQVTRRKSRMSMWGGLILVVFGVFATYDLFHPATERILPLPIQSVVFFGPILLAIGCVTFVRGFAWGASVIFRRAVLVLGSAMLVIGACPWLYTSYLIGRRPGNEGAGCSGR